jgi:hypothetical protein
MRHSQIGKGEPVDAQGRKQVASKPQLIEVHDISERVEIAVKLNKRFDSEIERQMDGNGEFWVDKFNLRP